MGGRVGTDRVLAVAETVLVAAIWSSSFVGVKLALAHAGPLTVAGLRYFLAFALLIPWLGPRLKELPSSVWRRFAVMGIAQYAVGNGALFWSLRTLSATAGSLALCVVPIAVLFLEVVLRGARPRALTVLGVGLSVGGCALFFSPRLSSGDPVALGLLGIAILAFAVFPIVGREMAQGRRVGTIPLTAIPLGIGGGLILVVALVTEGVPRIPLAGWGVIVGLAVVNTALAYLLYTHALRHLTATEANVILNLTPAGTAVIAWVSLGERLLPVQIGAMAAVVAGVVLVQWRKGNRYGQAHPLTSSRSS